MTKKIDYEKLWKYLQDGGADIWAPNDVAWLGTFEREDDLVVEVNGSEVCGINYCFTKEDLPRIVNDFISVGGTIEVINRELEKEKASIDDSEDVETDSSIICGESPYSDMFFATTKSGIQSETYCYDEWGVDQYYQGDLAEKLKLCLRYFPELGIKGVIEGDFLAKKSDVRTETINEEKLYTFGYQSIKYGIPVDHTIGKKIKDAEVTIVFHTTYLHNEIDEWEAKPGIFEKLNDIKSVVVLTKEKLDSFNIN
tara:strand:- start:407 stop:1168 length:762 start_codon:yes stop_codon:yes gene_type:complete